MGLGLQARPLSPGHAGLAAPPYPRLRAVRGGVGRLWSPRPFALRFAVDPRISSASFPSVMGMLHALLRRTGRWRRSPANPCSAPHGPRLTVVEACRTVLVRRLELGLRQPHTSRGCHAVPALRDRLRS